MLVLSRMRDELIGLQTSDGFITIRVVDFKQGYKGRRVKLGIDAPQSVVVHRGEVWQQIAERREERGDGDRD